MTLHEKPANNTHWSTRTIAAAAGISEASVRRIWRAHGLKAAPGENLQAQPRSRVQIAKLSGRPSTMLSQPCAFSRGTTLGFLTGSYVPTLGVKTQRNLRLSPPMKGN
jgi:hypothetical protein